MSTGKGKGKGVFNLMGVCAPCFKPEEQDDSSTGGGGDGSTPLSSGEAGDAVANLTLPDNDNLALWKYLDIGKHGGKEYSCATVKGEPSKCGSQNIIQFGLLGNGGILLGLHVGHGSSNFCAIFVHSKLFKNLINIDTKDTSIEDDLRQAFFITEKQWLQFVFTRFKVDRLIAAAGASSLVGLIGGEHVYLAHVGDSRALIGETGESNCILPRSLTTEDNVNDPMVRAELLIDHPEPDFMTQNSDGVYSIKGQSQISKSIGDSYLKRSDLNMDDIPEYKLNSPLTTDALSATPFIKTTAIEQNQHFLVFASKELWDLLPNSEVVLVVQMNPRKGIAATLIRYALDKVATRNNLTYSELQKASDGRNKYYNDISAAVVFFKETGTVTLMEEAQQGAVAETGSSSTGTVTLIEAAQQGAVTETGSSSTGTDYFTGLEDEDFDDYLLCLEHKDFDDDMIGLEDVPPPALP